MSDFLTVHELAELIRCTPNAIYKRVYRGLIPERAIVRMGPRQILFKRDILNRTVLKGGYTYQGPESAESTTDDGGEQ